MTYYWDAPQTKMLVKCIKKIRSMTGHRDLEAYRRFLDLLAWHFKFEDAEKPDLDNKVIDEVLKIFDFDLLHDEVHDYFGATFEVLELGSKCHGQFFTPENLSDCMAQMMLPHEDPKQFPITVLDPASGTGRLLISAFNILGYKGIYFGCDIDSLVYRISLLNIYTYQIPAMILCANALIVDLSPKSPNWRNYANLWNPPYWDKLIKMGEVQEASEEQKEMVQAVNNQAMAQATLLDFRIKRDVEIKAIEKGGSPP